MDARDRIIVALDFQASADAESLVERLGESAVSYKVGLELLTAAAPSVIRQLVAAGKSVFLDLKLLEISNSVAGAVEAAAKLGVSMVTVHASGGSAVLRAAVEAARPYPEVKVLALTVVTSMRDADLLEVGVDATVQEQVLRLADLAREAGCHGVVASPQEALLLREALPRRMLIVTPGTRMATNPKNDQARTATPAEAVRAGATLLVIGRAISRASDPVAEFHAVLDEVTEAVVQASAGA